MKKIIKISLCLWLLLPQICFAQKINYRTNTLMAYSYEIEGQKDHFNIYVNNENDELIFTIDPFDRPDYHTDYDMTLFNWTIFPEEYQNKIKSYIQMTQEETDFKSQLLSYMNTQLLIWQTFHPELSIIIPENEEEIVTFNQEMEARLLKPDWIHDYELIDTLTIPKSGNFRLLSDVCQIEENEANWTIHDCEENAIITVMEGENDEIKSYALNQNLKYIEAGNITKKWTFQITLVKAEEKIPEATPNEEEKEEPKEDEEISKPQIEIKPNEFENQEVKKKPIKEEKALKLLNVPDTKENNWLYPLLGGVLLIAYIKWLS